MKARTVLVLGIFLLMACSRSYEGNPYPKIVRSGDAITITESPTSIIKLSASDIKSVRLEENYLPTKTNLWWYDCIIRVPEQVIAFHVPGASWERGKSRPIEIPRLAESEFNKIKEVIL
jgi:hypothetical protein